MAKWLIILPNRIGDAVLATGIIEWVRQRDGESKFVLAASSYTRSLFDGLPNLERIIIFDKKRHDLHWVELWRKIKGVRWEGVIDFRNSAIAYLIRAQKRFVRKSLKGSLRRQHRVVQLAQIIRKEANGFIPSPVLWVDPEQDRIAKNLIGSRPTLAVAPTANWIGKQWPADRFLNIVTKFLETYEDSQVALFAAPEEKESIRTILDHSKGAPVLDLIDPNLSLLNVAACIKACRLFLGNDSGLMHISAAVCTPTIGLFGPSDEGIYGPWNNPSDPSHIVVRGRGLSDMASEPDFSFCKSNTCYMLDIPVEDVFQTVCRKWETIMSGY